MIAIVATIAMIVSGAVAEVPMQRCTSTSRCEHTQHHYTLNHLDHLVSKLRQHITYNCNVSLCVNPSAAH